jgi:squalene synthase HpnC
MSSNVSPIHRSPTTLAAQRPVSLDEARAYCRTVATTHYENFSVVSWLVPRRLRPHFHAIYAYCRGADDLADETGDAGRAVILLDEWERELRACYNGQPTHPVFVALADTVRTCQLPIEPFTDLLTAFRRDQQQTRYDTFNAVLDYCRCSANPVGRLVLHLARDATVENFVLSDSICTGLQLVNFCQDVARDYDRGRIYLPFESWRRFGYDEAMFARREFNGAFAEMLKFEVGRAERFLLDGLPLAKSAPREIRTQVELFVRGGLEVVAAIRRIGYNVWATRPTVSRLSKLRLFTRTWLRSWYGP